MTLDEIPLYEWGAWPPDLLTKRQLYAAGFQTGKHLPPPAGKVAREKSPDGYMLLYDQDAATPRAPASDAQRAALEKARSLAELVHYCPGCKSFAYTRPITKKRALERQENCPVCHHLQAAQETAVEWMESDFVILDTETTGLYDAGIVQLGIIDRDGSALLDTLLNPEKEIEPEAQAIHGITAAMVASAPTFAEIYPALAQAVEGKTLIIYNDDFDWNIVRSLCRRHQLKIPKPAEINCAMHLYAQYVGDWSDRHDSFTWQPLPGGDHSALGDCRATLRLLKEMAADVET